MASYRVLVIKLIWAEMVMYTIGLTPIYIKNANLRGICNLLLTNIPRKNLWNRENCNGLIFEKIKVHQKKNFEKTKDSLQNFHRWHVGYFWWFSEGCAANPSTCQNRPDLTQPARFGRFLGIGELSCEIFFLQWIGLVSNDKIHKFTNPTKLI